MRLKTSLMDQRWGRLHREFAPVGTLLAASFAALDTKNPRLKHVTTNICIHHQETLQIDTSPAPQTAPLWESQYGKSTFPTRLLNEFSVHGNMLSFPARSDVASKQGCFDPKPGGDVRC